MARRLFLSFFLKRSVRLISTNRLVDNTIYAKIVLCLFLHAIFILLVAMEFATREIISFDSLE